ncbi:MAG: hypothetical protein WAW81_02225 [Minisyncoccia bacterium]
MPRSLHHSNLLIGAPENAESYLRSLCKSLDIAIANNPDFFAFRMSTFGIDEARELRLLSARKAIATASAGQGGKKIFFISPERITLEAQNALLKTFEDPSTDTHFFLVVKEEASIEPTLLSRMQAFHVGTRPELTQAEKFLTLPLKDRLLFAKKFVDDEESLPDFLDNLLLFLRKEKKANHIIESVYNVRRFALDPASLPRLVIEHLSLVL